VNGVNETEWSRTPRRICFSRHALIKGIESTARTRFSKRQLLVVLSQRFLGRADIAAVAASVRRSRRDCDHRSTPVASLSGKQRQWRGEKTIDTFKEWKKLDCENISSASCNANGDGVNIDWSLRTRNRRRGKRN